MLLRSLSVRSLQRPIASSLSSSHQLPRSPLALAPYPRSTFRTMAAPKNRVYRSAINPATPHTASFIFLHGSGGGGADFHVALTRFCADLKYVNIICPEAQERPYTLAGGEKMQVWFNRTSLSLKCPEDPEGIARSVEVVEALVKEEAARGIGRDRIMIGGFSQGGCLAYYCAYGDGRKDAQPFAGCVTSGSFLPDLCSLFSAENEKTRIPEARRKTPLLMMHGEQDDMIPLEHSKSTYERFSKILPNATYLPFPNLSHEVDNRVLRGIKDMLKSVLPPV